MVEVDASLMSRMVLRLLRQIMAEEGPTDGKLAGVVKLIAEKTSSDVCSCYVMQEDSVSLELFATHGLDARAIHSTVLKVGEGIVGKSAEKRSSMPVSDAWTHPDFSYKPETGEDVYHSLLAVPIVRGKRVLGVLVVQDKIQRDYVDAEVETLETVAMVLAEMFTQEEFISYRRSIKGAYIERKIKCVSLGSGYGLGRAVLRTPRPKISHVIASDIGTEIIKFTIGYDKMIASLEDYKKLDKGEHKDIMEAYSMVANDKGWKNKIIAYIKEGLAAETATEKAYQDMWERLSGVDNQYLRERIHDLRDITDRLLQFLIYGKIGATHKELPEHTIIVARNMGPAELLDYDLTKVRGLVVEEATPTMHVAIVAKALNIPLVCRVGDGFAKIADGDEIGVDGGSGHLFIEPSEHIRKEFYKWFAEKKKLQDKYNKLKNIPSKTSDGVDVKLYLNVGLPFDYDYIKRTGCDGVGLFRTEIPFMASAKMPTVEEQTEFYGNLVKVLKGKRLVFRTLDVGSDKVLPYWDKVKEENPAMGWRSIRITLDRPSIMSKQLRAMIRATSGGELNVMFPMVSNVSELLEAKEILQNEIAKETEAGNEIPAKVNVGTMIEVPSAVFSLKDILKEVDFISVGTNDLAQFVFASDRANPKLQDRYDTLSPAFLQIMKKIIDEANDAGVTASVCGEMAGRPLEAMALLALGYRNLSMSGSQYGAVKSMLLSLSLGDLEKDMPKIMAINDVSLRKYFKDYAEVNQIDL